MKKVSLYSKVFFVSAVMIVTACTSLVRSGDRFPSSTQDQADLDFKREVVATHVNAISRNEAPSYKMTRGEIRLASKAKDMMMGTNAKIQMAGTIAGQTPSYYNNPNAFSDPGKEKTKQAKLLIADQNTKVKPGNSYRDAVYDQGMNEVFKFPSQSPSDKVKNQKAYLTPMKEADAMKMATAVKKTARRPQQYTNCYSNYDDYYEPNDYQSSAEDLVGDENRWLYDIYGYGVQFDDDWYKIYVPSNYRTVNLDLRFKDSCGDIDLKLYNAAGSLVASSTSSTDDEYISVTVSTGGYYYAKIYFGDYGNKYDFKWTTSYTGSPPDFYEPNDSISQAYDLSSWQGSWLSNLHGSGVSGSDDYYRIYVAAGYLNLSVDLRFLSGDLDLYLYNSSGTQIGKSDSSSLDEYISLRVPSAGYYYVRVIPYTSSSAGIIYDLKYITASSGPVYTEDRYEPNNTRSQASAVTTGTIITGSQFNDDWYQFYVPNGMRILTLDAAFTHSNGDIDMQLVDSNGVLLQSSVGNTNAEHISLTVPTGNAYYYVRFYGDNQGNGYEFVANLASSGPEDDAYGKPTQNNTLGKAYDLSNKEGIWLQNIQGLGIQKEQDFYKIYVSPSTKKLTIDCRFVYPSGVTGSLVDIELLNSTGQVIAKSQSVKKNEMIELYLQDGGTYYIRVYGDNRATPYDLKWFTRALNNPTSLPPAAPAGQVNVVEYYFTKLKRYFISSRPNELEMLDNGRDSLEVYRTGYYFRSYTSMAPGLSPVCRFFVKDPVITHFYAMTQADCDLVRPLPNFQDDGVDFYIKSPVNGACAPGEVAIYRLFNNGYEANKVSDGNHRYTTNLNEIQYMETLNSNNLNNKNWTNEGIVGCSPPL